MSNLANDFDSFEQFIDEDDLEFLDQQIDQNGSRVAYNRTDYGFEIRVSHRNLALQFFTNKTGIAPSYDSNQERKYSFRHAKINDTVNNAIADGKRKEVTIKELANYFKSS